LIISRKKAQAISGGARARLICTPDRQQVIALVKETIGGGCRRAQACEALGISLRTYQRWMRDGDNEMASLLMRKASLAGREVVR
jgi:transcriptional regulator with XRE-family HTH domain